PFWRGKQSSARQLAAQRGNVAALTAVRSGEASHARHMQSSLQRSEDKIFSVEVVDAWKVEFELYRARVGVGIGLNEGVGEVEIGARRRRGLVERALRVGGERRGCIRP